MIQKGGTHQGFEFIESSHAAKKWHGFKPAPATAKIQARGKTPNKNAARPAVSGNHDLTRERGRHFGHPRPRTPRSESESSDRLTLIPARQPMGSVCLTGLAAPHISVGNEVT